MKKKYAILVFGGLTILPFFYSCTQVLEPTFKSISKVTINRLGQSNSSISANLLFNNPNNFGVTLKEIDLDIFVNQSLLGHISQKTSLKINKRKDFVVPLAVELDTKKTLKNALISLFKQKTSITLKGKIKVTKAQIPKSIKIDFTTFQDISLF